MITKELYIRCVESIKKFNSFEEDLYKITDGGISFSKLDVISEVVQNLESLLEYCTKDKVDTIGSNLSYFLYDLDGGEEYHSGCITENGKEIKLSTVEDLWNFIKKEHPEIEA